MSQLKVSPGTGLDLSAVKKARDKYGTNELTEREQVTTVDRFVKQFENPLIIILLVAGGATLLLGEYVDMMVIFIAVLVNVVVGTIQEERASNAFSALKESQSREATVIRDGDRRVVPAEDVVVGDVVELDAGDYVSADMRLIEEENLKVNEASLTGEWMSVPKDADKITEERPVPDRVNMAYKGTLVDSGAGKGVVVAVGDQTELGKIAKELTSKEETDTPIQRHMRRLAQFLSIISVLIVALIFILGVIRGEGLVEMLLMSIAVAVSVVPEGLPAAVTVVLAIGMENILSRGGLVKNLRAAETLGSTTVIMTDKTGTLTQAKMAVAELISSGKMSGEAPDKSMGGGNLSSPQKHLLEGAMTNSNAFVETSNGKQTVHGQPIEKAIVVRGLEAGFDKEEIDKRRKDFLTFSSENRFAASVSEPKAGKSRGQNELFVSGAPELLLEHSSKLSTEAGNETLTEEKRKQIEAVQTQKSSEGKRIIAVAYKPHAAEKIEKEDEGTPAEGQIEDLVFLGLISFEDPIRDDVPDAIKQAKSAGVHVLMITGDNSNTASFVAKNAGIAEGHVRPVTGSDLDEMHDKGVVRAVTERNVFARILPSQKLRVSRLLRDQSEVVAMTGDGVNDAPALRSADIGVSVGSGTEVAKEASDLILLDDSFSIIVSAIEEGRRIIDNLKKIVAHLLSASFGEIFLIAGALVVSLPLPILPAQILWINIVEGGLLTFVFAFEPPAADVMKRDPREGRVQDLISTPIKWLIFASGTITGLAAFGLYTWLHSSGIALGNIRTIMFVVLTIDALLFTLSLKNFYQPLHKIDFTNNKILFVSLALSIAALLAALFIAPLRQLLSLTVLSGMDWMLLAGVGIFDLAVVEIAKYFLFQHKQTE